MGDLPTIDDLLKKNKKASDNSTNNDFTTESPEIEEKLQKKIAMISEKEKEVETMRRAAKIGYPHIDLEKFPISQEALRQVTKEHPVKCV